MVAFAAMLTEERQSSSSSLGADKHSGGDRGDGFVRVGGRLQWSSQRVVEMRICKADTG